MAVVEMGEEDPEQVGSEITEEASSGGLADTLAEAAIALTTGAPPQIQRSFFKVVNRVFVAGAEWPANYLEGRAKITAARAKVQIAKHQSEAADILSQQKARDVVNRGTAKSAVGQFANPDMAQRAAEFHAAHILREQANMEDVVSAAAEDLHNNPPSSDSTSEIDDDWIHAFLREAATRSAEEYKIMFGRILAGELRSPGTFSISTVEIFSKLNTKTANIFERACNLTTNIFGSARIISQGFADPGSNGLQSFGLSYEDLAKLVEAGLVRSDFSEQNNIPSALYKPGLGLDYAGSVIFLRPADTDAGRSYNAQLELGGPGLTAAGQELRSVVTMKPSTDYLKALSKWLSTFHFEVFNNIRQENGQTVGNKIGPID